MKKVEFMLNDEVSYEELLQKLFEIKNIELQDFKVHKDDKLYHYFPFKHNNCETFYDEVKPMKKTITVSLFKDKGTNEYVADVTGQILGDKKSYKTYNASKYEKIESKDFEVEEEDDWNLAENGKSDYDTEEYGDLAVEKCRDLILKDVRTKKDFNMSFTNYDNVEKIINKRFGDL